MTIDTSLTKVIDLLAQLTIFNQYDFSEFLSRFIKVVIHIIPADSCLIYFFDKETKQLTLVGSKKPHENAVGNIHMKAGEGITGWVAEHHKTVAIEEKAYEDPRFKFFRELPEDKYESFLSVPISDDSGVVGVINFQNKKIQKFSQEEIHTIESLVKIVASAFVSTVLSRKVNKLENQLEERKLIEKAKGVLMKFKNISEDEAFKLLRSEAMNKRKSMKDIAEAVLLVYQLK